MEQKRLIGLRKKINKKRPSFRRVESWRYKRVKDSWRKARGIDSRTRIKSKSGVKSDLNNKKHAVKVSAKLGVRKRIAVIDYAQSRGFKILNLGISQRELDSLEAALESTIEDLEDLEDEDLLEDED